MYSIFALVLIVVAFIVRRYVVFVVRVNSHSMEPTLHDGEFVVARRVHDKTPIKKGDIVVVNSTELGRAIIKRVAGAPGEKITIEGQSYRAPTGHYFLLGDNTEHSSDSRKWRQPYIPKHAIDGKVLRSSSH